MKSKLKMSLDAAYAALDQRAKGILQLLRKEGFSPVSCGYFAGHYWADEAGEYHRDVFPIPVITVKGLCDIELDFEHTGVTAKLKKTAALVLDYSALNDMRFVVCGTQDWQKEYKKEKESMEVVLNQMGNSEKEAFFFSFLFPADLEQQEILLVVRKLSQLGFYY